LYAIFQKIVYKMPVSGARPPPRGATAAGSGARRGGFRAVRHGLPCAHRWCL